MSISSDWSWSNFKATTLLKMLGGKAVQHLRKFVNEPCWWSLESDDRIYLILRSRRLHHRPHHRNHLCLACWSEPTTFVFINGEPSNNIWKVISDGIGYLPVGQRYQFHSCHKNISSDILKPIKAHRRQKKRHACAHLKNRHFRVKLCSAAFPYNHLGRLGLVNVVMIGLVDTVFQIFPCCAKFSSMERTMEHLLGLSGIIRFCSG